MRTARALGAGALEWDGTDEMRLDDGPAVKLEWIETYRWTLDDGSTLDLSRSSRQPGWYALRLSTMLLGRDDSFF